MAENAQSGKKNARLHVVLRSKRYRSAPYQQKRYKYLDFFSFYRQTPTLCPLWIVYSLKRGQRVLTLYLGMSLLKASSCCSFVYMVK